MKCTNCLFGLAGLSTVLAATPQIQILHRHVSSSTDYRPNFGVRGSVGELTVNGTALLHGTDAAQGAQQEESEIGWDTYQLVASVDTIPADEWPMTSIPACRLKRRTKIKEGLQDQILLTLGSSGHPVSIAYTTSAHIKACAATTDIPFTQADYSAFNTTVVVRTPTRIPAPRLHAPVIPKINPDGTQAEPEVEKSFLAKYWMYILPLLFVFINASVAGQGEEAPRGGGGGAAAAPARSQ